jgi:hypothetical protein
MIRRNRILLAAAAVLFAAHCLPAQIRVAVEDGSNEGTGAGLVAQLNNDTFFDFTATLVTQAQIDTPGELAAFDVVILGGSGTNDADWTDAMADALRAWVEAGGGAILTGWGLLEFDNLPAGAITDLDAIFPTQNTAAINEWANSDGLIDIVAVHPAVDGISDFSVGDFANTCCIELNDEAAEAGDLVLGTMAGGSFKGDGIAIAVKEAVGEGCTAYLGPIYMGSTGNYPDVVPALRSGTPDRLLEQTAAWASTCTAFVPTPFYEVPAAGPVGLAALAGLLALAGALRLRWRP